MRTGARTRYHLLRNEWSIHFNVTADGKLFCGDGGDPGQVAKAPDGEWIYLFHPQLLENRGVEDAGLIRPGVFQAEKLVNMLKHKYYAGADVCVRGGSGEGEDLGGRLRWSRGRSLTVAAR